MYSRECGDDSGFDMTAAWQKQREEFLERFEAITATPGYGTNVGAMRRSGRARNDDR